MLLVASIALSQDERLRKRAYDTLVPGLARPHFGCHFGTESGEPKDIVKVCYQHLIILLYNSFI